MSRFEYSERPAKYSLGVQEGEIDIFVHESVAPKATDFNLYRLNGQAKAHFEVSGTFIPPKNDESWGYDKAIVVRRGPLSDWRTFVLIFPDPNEQTTYFDKLLNLVGSTRHLLDYLNSTDQPSAADIPQLLLATVGQNKPYETSWPVGADIRPAFAKWLKGVRDDGFDEEIQTEVNSAMQNAYNALSLQKREANEFTTEFVNPYGIRLEVLKTQTATLYPDFHLDDGSFELVPYNVRSPKKQLTLLTGISRLCALAVQGVYFGNHTSQDLPSNP